MLKVPYPAKFSVLMFRHSNEVSVATMNSPEISKAYSLLLLLSQLCSKSVLKHTGLEIAP